MDARGTHRAARARAGALRGEADDRRAGRARRADARRAARAGAPARRGRAGAGQDDGDQDARPGDRRRLPAHPVHARPRAGRPRRHADLQPEGRRVPGLARAGLRQPRARRRDQPRAGEGAERAARGHAGAAGDDRPRDVSRRPTRSSSWRRRTPSSREGTYALPEAQVDRFMLKVLIGYPSAAEEFVVVERQIAAAVATVQGARPGHAARLPARGGRRLRRPRGHRVCRPAGDRDPRSRGRRAGPTWRDC